MSTIMTTETSSKKTKNNMQKKPEKNIKHKENILSKKNSMF